MDDDPSTCLEHRGVLELHPSGYGFLRSLERGLFRCGDDPFVPASLIDRFKLRQGSLVHGSVRRARDRPGLRLTTVEDIDGLDPGTYLKRVPFDQRLPKNPEMWLKLEHEAQPAAMRVLDLLCPIGAGQRALIASPPRAGKTTILKQIGRSISLNYPEIQLVVLLIDERPEEVTDMQLEIDGEVFASSLDHDVESHVRLSRLVVDRCQRLVETGKDVFLLVDSLTRMTRAFNKLPGLSGPIGAGGLNIRALDIPKQLFASARRFAEGGSLSIVATVLIETDNRMDEVIYREFKGTGNLDLVLSQQIADRRVWPAIDIEQSGTRRVELFQDEATLHAATALRNTLSRMHPVDAVRELTRKLEQFRSNDELVRLVNGTLARS